MILLLILGTLDFITRNRYVELFEAYPMKTQSIVFGPSFVRLGNKTCTFAKHPTLSAFYRKVVFLSTNHKETLMFSYEVFYLKWY